MREATGRQLLVAEIGNTNTTFAVVGAECVLDAVSLRTSSLTEPAMLHSALEPLLASFPGLEDSVVCSVVPEGTVAVQAFFSSRFGGQTCVVDASLRLPFALAYEHPFSFGADRIALCTRGCMLAEGEGMVLVDVGTAITLDAMLPEGQYLGGMILPGLELMARSLHDYTAMLPHVEPARPSSLLGRSTAGCINSGIVWGTVAKIEGLIAMISREIRLLSPDACIRVVLTGGNARLLAALMHAPPEIDEDAVLKGAAYLFGLNLPGAC